MNFDQWISPPLSIKDKVASILGESKTSTYASSMNKVSNSNIEETGSDNKPKFYRRDITSNEMDLSLPKAKNMKRIGNNFRIIRSPKANEEKKISLLRGNMATRNRNIMHMGTTKNSFLKTQKNNKNPQEKMNIALYNKTFSGRNTGMSRKSQLQIRYLSNDSRNDKDMVFSEKYASKKSMNLDKILEENRENAGSQATICAESKNPSKNNTPAIDGSKEEKEGDLKPLVTHESQEESKISPENIFVYYDSEVIHHLHTTTKLSLNEIFVKLQSGDTEMNNMYTKYLENKRKILKTVYPSVIHSAISSPQNSNTREGRNGNLNINLDLSNAWVGNRGRKSIRGKVLDMASKNFSNSSQIKSKIFKGNSRKPNKWVQRQFPL